MIFARIILVAGLLFLLVAAGFIGLGLYWREEFKTVEAAETVRLPVDFSKAGEYTANLHQTYQYGHDQGLELRLAPGFASFEEGAALIQGLDGEIRIQAGDGSIVHEGPLQARPLEEADEAALERYWRGVVPLAVFRPFPPGDYALTLWVTQAAPGVVGRDQLVVGKHWLCGCEGRFGANLAFTVGGVAACLGLVPIIGGISMARAARRAVDGSPSTACA